MLTNMEMTCSKSILNNVVLSINLCMRLFSQRISHLTITSKNKVALCHKKWIDSKQQQQQQPIAVANVAKDPLDYKNRAINVLEQKPITEKFDFTVH